MGIANEEKPRSSVMPLSLLCGFLSRAAVERVVDKAATADTVNCSLAHNHSKHTDS